MTFSLQLPKMDTFLIKPTILPDGSRRLSPDELEALAQRAGELCTNRVMNVLKDGQIRAGDKICVTYELEITE